ncbi:iclR helix-turn-helix domain protein [Mycobacterium kansasii 824]|nr:iclR helix-turn-helix domain protein [Mycobacterium kansasii 824]
MSDIARSVQEPTGRRRAVLRVLRASRVPMSIVAIADALEIHPNTVRFHLDALVADGQAQRVESGPRGPGRPPQMFSAVRQMDRGGARHYRLLAEILSNGLAAEPDSQAKALAAGRAWGQRLEAPATDSNAEKSIEHLVGVLDQLGFAPERRVSDGQHQLGLRHCRFWKSPKADPPSSVRSTSGSCKELWNHGRRQSASSGSTCSPSQTCVWPTSR